LVTQAQAGDPQAFGTLIERFQNMAFGYAYAILRDVQTAEDAAQEAFVEAYRCLDRLEIPQAFPAWLKRIVLKQCDRLTRGKRPTLVPLDSADGEANHAAGARESAAEAPDQPEAWAERHELQQQILEGLAALDENHRTVTTLYYIDGYAQREIAAFLDVPPSTVKSRLHTSRKLLRERMMTMVKDALAGSALPESFTEETLTRAVEEAAELNKAQKFSEAEELLRDVVAKTPKDAPAVLTAALKELNRTLMWGQYNAQLFDERWNELVANGRAILAENPDAEGKVWCELARTLLYIPRMVEAVEHLQAWIAARGDNLERLGMLAWATGCAGDYVGAHQLWIACKGVAMRETAMRTLPAATAIDQLRRVCESLVDCFAAAGEELDDDGLRDVAVQIAEEGLMEARVLAPDGVPGAAVDEPQQWVRIHHSAGIPATARALAREFADHTQAEGSADTRITALGLRAWFDTSEATVSDAVAMAQTLIEAGEWDRLERLRQHIRGFRIGGRPDPEIETAKGVLAQLQSVPGERANLARCTWQWTRYDVWAYLRNDDLAGAQLVAREGANALGLEEAGISLVIAATAAGKATPSEVIDLLAHKGPKALDPVGMFGWYAIAREAAAAGDVEKAATALYQALRGWTNPPLAYVRLWERDAYWGEVARHPDIRRLYKDKRARIGPVYGELFYFPGW